MNKNLFSLVLYIIIVNKILCFNNLYDCSKLNKSFLFNSQNTNITLITELISLNEINFNCSVFNTSNTIIFAAKYKIILSEAIDMNFMLTLSPLKLQFRNFKGIDIGYSIVRNVLNSTSVIRINYEVFDFNFYQNNQLVTNLCDQTKINYSNFEYFSEQYSITFEQNVKYYKNMCPYYFNNSLINDLKLTYLSHGFFDNYPTFQNLNESLMVISTQV